MKRALFPPVLVLLSGPALAQNQEAQAIGATVAGVAGILMLVLIGVTVGWLGEPSRKRSLFGLLGGCCVRNRRFDCRGRNSSTARSFSCQMGGQLYYGLDRRDDAYSDRTPCAKVIGFMSNGWRQTGGHAK